MDGNSAVRGIMKGSVMCEGYQYKMSNFKRLLVSLVNSWTHCTLQAEPSFLRLSFRGEK